MKTKTPILEYCASMETGSKRPRWGFRFRTAEGEMLIESARKFRSQAQAEREFVSLIKSVATNQYTVETAMRAEAPGASVSLDQRCRLAKAAGSGAHAIAKGALKPVSAGRACLRPSLPGRFG